MNRPIRVDWEGALKETREKMERSGKGGVSEGDEEEEGGTALSSVIRK